MPRRLHQTARATYSACTKRQLSLSNDAPTFYCLNAFPRANVNLRHMAPVGVTLPIFFSSVWPTLTVWILLYISDYALTITCARLYRDGVCEKLAFEGSFELNPIFQKDIDSLRWFSPRFLAMLFVTSGLLALVWFLSSESVPEMYVFLAGAMILLEITVHTRHLRNLFMFRAMLKSDCVRGRIEYSRPFILRMSSDELFIFSAMFLLLFVFTESWFVLGGATTCFSTAIKQRQLARKAASKAAVVIQPETIS
jgi:hypothetical protein